MRPLFRRGARVWWFLLPLAGCATEKPLAEPSRAPAPGPSEPAPVPGVTQQRIPGRFAPPVARRELGWPDRYDGLPAGAPYRPRF